MFSRRPDAFLNPQFWAEDGRNWYADAYNHGVIYSLITPEAGYYQTASRLVAILAQPFPLEWGPIIFNAVALGVKLLVVNFIVSGRMSHLIPSLGGRLAVAFVYLALPHSYETHGNLTNIQWHLALLSFLIIVACDVATRAWRVFDTLVVLLFALSGPIAILLLPIAIVKFAVHRGKAAIVFAALLALGSLVQIASLLTTERLPHPLGASFDGAMKIVAGHLFLSAIVGERGYHYAIEASLLTAVTATFVTLAGMAALGYAFVVSRLELRLLMIFALMIFSAAMVSPAVSDEMPQWTAMLQPGAGSRYWLIPIFCVFLVLLQFARKAEYPLIRYAATGLLGLSLIGIIADWRYPPLRDLDFQHHAARFEAAAPGEEIVIPINPDWQMVLRKKE